jgi:glycosyltransferase involved in cell wall biosynthesis
MDKVSIIVPIYNKEIPLRACLDSICAQTYKNYEVLLIDDGSTDGSSEIADFYAKKEPRMKVIHQRNRGVSAARNVGMEASTGKWLVFVDADDWIGADYIEKLVEEAVPEGVTAFNHLTVAQGEISSPKHVRSKRIYANVPEPGSLEYNGALGAEYDGFYTVYPKIYDSSVIRKNHLRFDERFQFSEDTIFNQLFILHAARVRVDCQELEYYRMRDYSSLCVPLRYIGNIELLKMERNIQMSFYEKYGMPECLFVPCVFSVLKDIERVFTNRVDFNRLGYTHTINREFGEIIGMYYVPKTQFMRLYKYLLVYHPFLFFVLRSIQSMKKKIS